MGTMIDGKAIASKMRKELTVQITALKERKIQPKLAVILVGDDEASAAYLRSKKNACIKAGIEFADYILPANTSMAALQELIESLNQDPAVHGIMLELPLPKGMNAKEAVTWIKPEKDVDGASPVSMGYLLSGQDWLFPATPQSVLEIIHQCGVDLLQPHIVMVGYGATVGKPLVPLLLRELPTLTVCRSKTKDVKAITLQADILIAATGKPNLIRGDMIKPGAVVIDAGISQIGDHLVGDVNYDEAMQVAAQVTPVPGGVGSLTTAILMGNVLKAMKIQGII